MTNSPGHDGPQLGPAELVEVADRVFAYIQPDGSWWINNTGVVVGDTSVVCIDSCATERRTRAFRDAVTQVSARPVSVLVNTHHHGDHTNGNSIIEAATIVAHENCRTEMLAFGPPRNAGIWDPVDWGTVPLTPPTITFFDRLRLWCDDRPIELNYVGQSAHTNNDSLIWLPEQQVLFCGDLLFHGGTPFLLLGSVMGAIDVLLNRVAAVPARVIVPGHGPPCDRSLIAKTVDYLEFVLAMAKAGRAAGLTPLETARETELGAFSEWLDSERIVGNLHRAYADLEGPQARVDALGALSDMVAYNGGKPLSCYA